KVFMQRSARLLILLGLLLGAAAMVAIATALNSNTPRTVEAPLVAKVVVSQQAIAINTRILTGAVTLADWPLQALRPDTITDTEDVIGKISTTPIVPGQMIVSGMLVDKPAAEESRGGVASFVIPDAKVAVAFPIDSLSGVADALRNGDRIDLLVSFDMVVSQTANSGAVIKRVTQTALQDIEILRVGSWTANAEAGTAGNPASMLTLLVTPQDALVLKFLRETASNVQFALRPAGNHRVVKTQPVVIEYVDQRFNFGGTLTGPR